MASLPVHAKSLSSSIIPLPICKKSLTLELLTIWTSQDNKLSTLSFHVSKAMPLLKPIDKQTLPSSKMIKFASKTSSSVSKIEILSSKLLNPVSSINKTIFSASLMKSTMLPKIATFTLPLKNFKPTLQSKTANHLKRPESFLSECRFWTCVS